MSALLSEAGLATPETVVCERVDDAMDAIRQMEDVIIKPLFGSADPSPEAERSRLEIACLGTVPFDPELARHCDRGIPLEDRLGTPVGRALDHVAQQLLDSLP